MFSAEHKDDRQNRPTCSIYPLHPPDSRVLLRYSPDLTRTDRLIVAASSLFIVGSVAWAPLCIVWAWRRWRRVENKRRKAWYAAMALAGIAILAAGPHRSPRFGKLMRVKRWKLWTNWMRFIAMEVILDRPGNLIQNSNNDDKTESSDPLLKDKSVILSFSPHGIFPFSLAFGVIDEQTFGFIRPVVATATAFFPFVRDFLSWFQAIDASRDAVDQAVVRGDRIGLVPGGISEMFEGYPKPSTHPDEEYTIIRQGFLRLAARYNVPVMPIFCFGATKMFRRLDIPILERLSQWFRISLCVFYGVCGLPIPFRQRLSYVIGETIYPPPGKSNSGSRNDEDERVRVMQEQFCRELVRIFDRHKEAYGWGHKTLKLLSR